MKSSLYRVILSDTNVFLRYLLVDDISQYEKTSAIIRRSRPVVITDVFSRNGITASVTLEIRLGETSGDYR